MWFGSGQGTFSGWPWLAPPGWPQSQHTWRTNSYLAGAPPNHLLKGQIHRAPEPHSIESSWWGQLLHSSSSSVVSSVLALGVKPSQWCANSNQSSTTTGQCKQPTGGMHLVPPAQMTMEAVPLGPTGHPLDKATLTRPGDTAALPVIVNVWLSSTHKNGNFRWFNIIQNYRTDILVSLQNLLLITQL